MTRQVYEQTKNEELVFIVARRLDRPSHCKLTVDAIPPDVYSPPGQGGANDNQFVGVAESSRLVCTEPPPDTVDGYVMLQNKENRNWS